MSAEWYRIENEDEVPSPSLLIYPDRVKANIDRMIEIANGDASRLRPHVKTHKMGEVVKLQLEAGIKKFKCATIAECEMTAEAGAPDVLLAYQPVGPNIDRLAKLAEKFPDTSFAAVVDDPDIAADISKRFASEPKPLRVFVDIDCGMHRTGTSPGKIAMVLCEELEGLKGVEYAGLHIYDGHIHDEGVRDRETRWKEDFVAVKELIAELKGAGFEPLVIIGGGSPTFGIHASHESWECSPGTTLLWDAGYGSHFPDLGFQSAAMLLTRVISKPGANRVCVDLGHKAVSAEHPIKDRVRLQNKLSDATPVMQSEEHLVLEFASTDQIQVGDVIYGMPWHICPTVALHGEAVVIEGGRATGETWSVRARNRKISV